MKNVTHKTADQAANGGVLIPSDMLPANAERWFPRRKAQVVAAVHAGALTVAQACRRYDLSPEEFREWERHYQAGDLGKPNFSAQRRGSALH
jgi:transposase-like protein